MTTPVRLRLPLAALAGLALLSCGPVPQPPPDRELLDAFAAERAAFETLARDPAGAPLPDRPEGLRRVEVPGGTEFVVWREDLFGPGGTCVKGYTWRTEPPEIVESSLDGYRCPENSVRAYRRIEGSWYLYYASEN